MFTLYRYSDDGVKTQGLLFHNGKYICDTLERPWKNNERKVSSIPVGKYSIRPIKSPNNGDCVEVLNVSERSYIQIHAANTVTELEGCIAVGVKSVDLLLHSRLNLATILKLLGDNTDILEVGPL